MKEYMQHNALIAKVEKDFIQTVKYYYLCGGQHMFTDHKARTKAAELGTILTVLKTL